jgi:hypothetical protein
MTRRLVDIYSGVVEGRVLLAFPGAVDSLRFTPAQAKIMAKKLWRLAEEAELGPEDAGAAAAGALRPIGGEVEAAGR